ncbi:hypothetical protein [uncultured Erythrobacter sp.]|uniref:hypothetical protein n=1 Tax=uncultured Erythrobacter sp. TaxID=263913 RepID=UPI00260353E8|nr:hypothetical protein [uncultured Erythrobacter sp.]
MSLIAASPPATGLEGLGREVSDNELSEMRGKFVRADNIHFFGVELLQSWQSANGVTVLAMLRFNVDFANGAGNLEGASPMIQISWDRTCADCGDATMDVSGLQAESSPGLASNAVNSTFSIGRLEGVEGLVQTQEIAGSNNNVLNTLNVSVVPSGSIQSLPMEEVSLIDSSASLVTDGGEIIDFQVARDQLGIVMTRGNESVRQGISGEMNQAAQHVLLQSSLNSIRNEMAITIGVDDLRRAQQHNVQTALSAMKGRGM